MHFDRFLIGKVSTHVQLPLDGALEPAFPPPSAGNLAGLGAEPAVGRDRASERLGGQLPPGVLSAF